MPVFGTQMFGSGGVSGYEIDNSCIFNDDDSPSLSFTPGSAGNQKTWTLSFWLKRSILSTQQTIMSRYVNANKYVKILINNANQLEYAVYNSNAGKKKALKEDAVNMDIKFLVQYISKCTDDKFWHESFQCWGWKF